MPSLPNVKASNASYAPSYIPTAVFIGGTSGIGQAMAELFAKQTNGRANIILIGRNKAPAEKIIASFPSPPDGVKHEFVECDASELEKVHKTSQELLQRLDKINILVLCATKLLFSAVETPEGLESSMVTRYYSRAKFATELLPLLKNAQAKGEDARVLTILGAAMGRQVDLTDLGVKKWKINRMAFHTGTFNDIMVKVLSDENPEIAFIHAYPGVVDTPGFNSLWITRLLHPILKFFITSSADCAENMMYALLNPDFAKGGYWLSKQADTLTLGENVNDEVTKAVWDHTIEVAKLK